MEKPEYMSLEDVADLLGVTYQLIYKLVRTGELPAIRLGKLYRVSREDLDLYLTNNKSQSAAGGVCSVCGTFYRSRDSLTQHCTADGCLAPICFDCWNRLGLRLCNEHSLGRAQTTTR